MFRRKASDVMQSVSGMLRRVLSAVVRTIGGRLTSAPDHVLLPDRTGGLKDFAGYSWVSTHACRGAVYEVVAAGYAPVERAAVVAESQAKPLKNIFVERPILEQEAGRYCSWKQVSILQMTNGCRHLFLAFSQNPPTGHTEYESMLRKADSESGCLVTPPDVFHAGSELFQEDDDVILVELLSQPQVVRFHEHAAQNGPFKVKDTAPLFAGDLAGPLGDESDAASGGRARHPVGSLSLRRLLQFLVEAPSIHDHHVWNELAHGNVKAYNECIHFGLLLWREFVTHGGYKDRWISDFDCFFQQKWSPLQTVGRRIADFFANGGTLCKEDGDARVLRCRSQTPTQPGLPQRAVRC